MKAMLCKKWGEPDSLVLEEIESKPLKSGEVRIKVRAAGVNFPDVLMIQGKYQFKPDFPFSPGAEAAGEVIEIASDVTNISIGDRVVAMTGHGAFAEEVITKSSKVSPNNKEMDFITAASLTLTYGTTAHALIQRGKLIENEYLLVHGAAGGVGLAAVEIGKALGAKVIATAGTDEKLSIATEHGADYVINYTSLPLFKDEVKRITNNSGANVINDPVGGDIFDQSLRCISWEGRLLVIGFASGRIPQAPANLALLKSCDIVGVFWGAWTERDPIGHNENMKKVIKWWKEGKVKPRISMVVPLEKTADALNALINRKVTGKAVIITD